MPTGNVCVCVCVCAFFRIEFTPDEVLDGVADLAANVNLLEGKNEALAGLLTVGASGKEMTKLGVGKLVDTTVGADGEVAPNVGGGLELHALDETCSTIMV